MRPFLFVVFLLSATSFAQSNSPNASSNISKPDQETPCTADEYRQFDFWLGTWSVTSAGSSGPSATNIISAEHGGCVVLEQYTAGKFTGMSINFYDSNTKQWRQTWMSNAGSALYLAGGLNNKGEMVLSDKGLSGSSKSINQITWTPLANGDVRQHWQATSDNGASWTTVFDGNYSKSTKLKK